MKEVCIARDLAKDNGVYRQRHELFYHLAKTSDHIKVKVFIANGMHLILFY